MLVKSTRFGSAEVPESDVYVFESGIPGFPDLRGVALVEASSTEHFAGLPDATGLFYVQSLDDDDLAFICLDPFWSVEGYQVDLDEEALSIEDPQEALVLAIITLNSEGVTANLRAPIVLNTRTKSAFQVVLQDPRWTTRHSLEG